MSPGSQYQGVSLRTILWLPCLLPTWAGEISVDLSKHSSCPIALSAQLFDLPILNGLIANPLDYWICPNTWFVTWSAQFPIHQIIWSSQALDMPNRHCRQCPFEWCRWWAGRWGERLAQPVWTPLKTKTKTEWLKRPVWTLRWLRWTLFSEPATISTGLAPSFPTIK